jgi:DNA-binding SARP family transcriptional activator
MEEPRSDSLMIQFRALGTAELKGPEGNELLSVLARPKLLALLSYLAAGSRRGFIRRDTLISLFWGDVDQERARNNLRQSLHHLRRALGEDVLASRGDDEVGLAEGQFWCDVRAFEEALDAGRQEEALALYRGELLEGFFVSDAPEFERWVDERRAELRGKAATAAWSLAETAEAERAAAAGQWARRALSLAPLDEDLVRRVVALLDRLGDRSGAVQEYESFARRLSDELELEPAPETRELIEAVRGRTTANGRAVQPEGMAARALHPLPADARPEPRGTRWGFRLGLVAGAAIVIGVVAVWAFSGDSPPGLDPRLVLVRTFDNQTGDPDLDPLGQMTADWITQGVQQTGLLKAVPPEAVLLLVIPLAEQRDDQQARTLAEATGAGTVITGVVYQFDDSIQIQAHVTDARSQTLLFSVESPRVGLANPGRAAEELRQRVVGGLATTLDGRITVYGNVALQPPTLEAYRAFSEGESLYTRAWTPGNVYLREEALQAFLRAFELDSTFSVALMKAAATLWALRRPFEADSLAQLAATHRDELSPFAESELDMLLAELAGDRIRALEAARLQPNTPIDPAIHAQWANQPREAIEHLKRADWYPEAVRSGGLFGVEQIYWQVLAASYHMLGEYETELEVAEEARDGYPNLLSLLDAEVRALAALGRIDEVEERLDESLTLPPQEGWLHGGVMAVAAIELWTHGHEEASQRASQRGVDWYLSRSPEEAATTAYRYGLAFAYYVARRWDEARTAFEELASDLPDDVNYPGYLGVLAARRGDRDEALRIYDAIQGMANPYDHGREAYWGACIYSSLGEREQAMVLLRDAFAQGRTFDLRLHVDIDLEQLHDYPPFQEFLAPKG